MARDYYAELRVQPDASTEAIKQAYRQLARTYHPDVNPSASAVERFTTITEAYHTLADPRRRMAYNQTILNDRSNSGTTTSTSTRGLSRREIRAAIERVIAYAVTGTLAGLALEWTLRWLVQATGQPQAGYLLLGGIGFLLGLFWGIDANFVIADFIAQKPGQLLFRTARFVSWIIGPFLASQHALSIIANLGGFHRLQALPIPWVSAGIGLLIAGYWTLRDH